MITTQDLLAAHPFLAGMTDTQLAQLATWGHRSQFHKDAHIFSEGAQADRFWLIREGQINLHAQVPGRGAVLVETLGAGTVLGWSWMFPPYRWHFAATAVESSLTVELNGPGVRSLCESDPAIGYELTRRFMQVVVERLQATRVRLLDLYAGS